MSSVLIKNGTVICMDPQRRILESADVLVVGDRIAALGPSGRVAAGPVDQQIDATGQLVIPGLINCHTHTVDYLMRGLGMDRTVVGWLQDLIWPCLRRVDEEDAYYASLLGYLECLKSGTTCVIDNCNMPAARIRNVDAIAQAAWDSGLQVVIARGYSDTRFVCPEDFLETPEQVIREYERVISLWHRGGQDRVRVWLTPVNLVHCSAQSIKAVAACAQQHGLGIHTHVAESKPERDAVIGRWGKGYVEVFSDLQVLGPLFHAVHSVWISDTEVRLLADAKASAIHNPTSNMLLASGIAPVTRLLGDGVNVALGTDNPNNSNDMLEAMKYAGLLQKVATLDPTVTPAGSTLEMATLAGARALGLQHEIGSLEVGKRADIAVVDMRRLHNIPVHDAVANLVYSARGGDVTTVLAGGQVLVDRGRTVFHDEDDLMDKVQRRGVALVRRAAAGGERGG